MTLQSVIWYAIFGICMTRCLSLTVLLMERRALRDSNLSNCIADERGVFRERRFSTVSPILGFAVYT